MVDIGLYDEKEIDTSSDELKEKVSNAIARYVIVNWDSVAEFEQNKINGRYELVIKVSS